MFAKLKGFVEEIIDDYIILNVNDVGYKVFCSNKTINQINDKDKKMSLYIETIVKEDSITLFGFINQIEKDVFNILCKVNGVGSRMSLKIISLLSVQDISSAIVNNNTKVFCNVPGVGPKLATRIVSELKDCSLTKSFEYNYDSDNVDDNTSVMDINIINDAVLALEGLGYQKLKVKEIVLKIIKDRPDLTLESVITNALKLL